MMNIIDIINKKKNKDILLEEEITFFINGYVNNEIPDYQISSLLMAILLNGMNEDETYYLTKAMINTGAIIDLSDVDGIVVDKHSSGGVGDSVTLVLTPILAACHLKVAKMSGRGLTHTGGTIDKLESIPNFKVMLDNKTFIKQVNEVGMAIIAQSDELVLADKKLYALRDVTGTVQSIPLIASSIISKKIASNADMILLDIKVGQGAFMNNEEDAYELATLMIKIAQKFNKKMRAVITAMDNPLGRSIGNNLEVIEAINILKNKEKHELRELSIDLAAIILKETNIVKTIDEGKLLALEKIENNEAFLKFKEFVNAQQGDTTYLDDVSKFARAAHVIAIKTPIKGYLNSIDALVLGQLACSLGAGRYTKDDLIDYSAGIVLKVGINDYLNENDIIGYLHSNKPITNEQLMLFNNAFKIGAFMINKAPLIRVVI
ncbi:MAG: thymidine phosphorylase [Bacilli bacterium]|nr:thymidine phosphorylase [Bacilli bacterium]